MERYATNERREQMLSGLRLAIESLHGAGCSRVYLDGSFITDKELPADFDACWEMDGVDVDRLAPVLLDFSDRRAAQKARFGGEIFPAELAADPLGTPFIDYFQLDRRTNRAKGIIAIELGVLT